MITSLRLVNFKNFADETLRVGPFTVIVGANASGKSNIRDAFRFLHGIGRGYTLAEIIGGKYGAGGFIEWTGIRGAMDEIIRLGHEEFCVALDATIENVGLDYSIKVATDEFRSGAFKVTYEELKHGSKAVYSGRGLLDTIWVQSEEYLATGEQPGQPFKSEQPALLQGTAMFGEKRLILDEPVKEMHSILAGISFLDIVPDRTREPTFPGRHALGDCGENLPAVLEEMCRDPHRKEVLMAWLRELTPMDICDFEFPTDPSGRIHLVFRESSGRKVSAYSASDGTLRFVTMLAALLSPSPAGMYFFEEIDNGIHPTRLHLLIDLIERQTSKNGIQVVTTTHSPDVLNLINDKTFSNTSVVSRLDDNDDATVRPVEDLPNVRKLRKSQGLGRLHAGGWMETALAFTEGYNEEDDED